MKHQESTTNNLYLPEMEHDACGIGAVVSIDGEKSRAIVDQALKIVEKLEHRAGRDADGSTGDGVGLMTQIPHVFFRAQPLSFELPGERDYGVAMLFLSPDRLKRAQARKLMEIVVQKEGLRFLGWREVPVNAGVLGERARACMPVIEQAFIAPPGGHCPGSGLRPAALHRPANLRAEQRRHATSAPCPAEPSSTRACSWSTSCGRSIPICRDEEYRQSAIAMVHSRFSTNTNPQLGARPPQPADSAQRRDQHHPRQRGPHARPGGDACHSPVLQRRHGQGAAGRSTARAPTRPCWTTRWNF